MRSRLAATTAATQDDSATGVPYAPFAPLDLDANRDTWVRLAVVPHPRSAARSGPLERLCIRQLRNRAAVFRSYTRVTKRNTSGGAIDQSRKTRRITASLPMAPV